MSTCTQAYRIHRPSLHTDTVHSTQSEHAFSVPMAKCVMISSFSVSEIGLLCGGDDVCSVADADADADDDMKARKEDFAPVSSVFAVFGSGECDSGVGKLKCLVKVLLLKFCAFL